jgi:hypothetical protein
MIGYRRRRRLGSIDSGGNNDAAATFDGDAMTMDGDALTFTGA